MKNSPAANMTQKGSAADNKKAVARKARPTSAHSELNCIAIKMVDNFRLRLNSNSFGKFPTDRGLGIKL